jgi:hypothetical protein
MSSSNQESNLLSLGTVLIESLLNPHRYDSSFITLADMNLKYMDAQEVKKLDSSFGWNKRHLRKAIAKQQQIREHSSSSSSSSTLSTRLPAARSENQRDFYGDESGTGELEEQDDAQNVEAVVMVRTRRGPLMQLLFGEPEWHFGGTAPVSHIRSVERWSREAQK